MRQNFNQVYDGSVLVNEQVFDWTVEDYEIAINSETQETELFALKNELAFLLGLDSMAVRVDEVADQKRMQFIGDATRAFEYQEAERSAKEFAANQFSGVVPDPVQSWADASGMSPKQAAENILKQAAIYNEALNKIRALRLSVKQSIVRAGSKEEVQQIFFDRLKSIFMIGS